MKIFENKNYICEIILFANENVAKRVRNIFLTQISANRCKTNIFVNYLQLQNYLLNTYDEGFVLLYSSPSRSRPPMHVWTGVNECIYTRVGTLHGADKGGIMTELRSKCEGPVWDCQLISGLTS